MNSDKHDKTGQSMEGNGKAIDIARLDERQKALKEDHENFKKDEKAEGVEASRQRGELYDKCDDLSQRISETSAKTEIIRGLVLALIAAGISAFFKYVI